MITGDKNFAPYTTTKLPPPFGRRNLVRRIKTRTLRVVAATASLVACWTIIAACDGGEDDVRTVHMRQPDTITHAVDGGDG